MERAPDEESEASVETFREEPAWREFYTHVLYDNPDVVTSNYREYEREIEWRDDPAPVVDHGERREEALSMFERARGEDENDEGESG